MVSMFKSLGLRWRVFMLVLAALLPALGLIVHAAVAEARRAEADRLRDVQGLAVQLATRVELIVRNTHQVLSVMALFDDLRGPDPEAATHLLANLHQDHPQYELFAVAEADGSLFASGITITPGVTAAGRTWFHRVIETGTFAGGGYQIGRQTGRETLNFGYPIRDPDGAVKRVIFTALSLDWLARELSGMAVRPDAVLTLLDEEGVVVYRRVDGDQWMGRAYADAPPIAPESPAPLVSHKMATSDSPLLRSHAVAAGPGWAYHVLVDVPRDAVLTAPFAGMWRSLLLLALVAVAALLIAWRGGDLLVNRPIATLLQGVRRLTDGELAVRVQVDPRGAPEIRHLAAAINAMAGSVERRVAERSAAIRESNEALREARDTAYAASQAKSAFLASMSHELRTPLNAVIGFSEVLNAEHFGPMNAKQREYVDDIRSSGLHLLSLINDVLDLSKVESGRLDPEWTRIPIARFLESCLVLVKETCFRHGITLELDVKSVDNLEIVADERRLKQILYNLLSNAAKFTPDGGRIRVVAAMTEGTVLPGGPRESMVELTVEDSGIGISPADQEHIFENFYQVRSSYANKSPGTGLGLPLVRRMTAMHGGRVYVESEGEGCGSRFVVVLPLNAERSVRRHIRADAVQNCEHEAGAGA